MPYAHVVDSTADIDCKISGKSAVCTESFGGDEANFPGISTETLDYSLIPVTITDSLPSITAPGIPTTPNSAHSTPTAHGAPTASNTSSGNTSAGSGTTTSSAAGSAGAGQSAGTTSSSKAGAAQAMVTGWVVGAAAVGLVFA